MISPVGACVPPADLRTPDILIDAQPTVDAGPLSTDMIFEEFSRKVSSRRIDLTLLSFMKSRLPASPPRRYRLELQALARVCNSKFTQVIKRKTTLE